MHSDTHATGGGWGHTNYVTQNCHGHVQIDHNKFEVMIIIIHNIW